MEATYNVNKEEKRVEIRFPFSPENHILKQLKANGFSYNPGLQVWTKDHVVNAKNQAGRIVYNFNANQPQSNGRN